LNENPESRADYEYENRKLALRVSDLQRYGIQTVLVDRYDEITELLRELSRRAYLNNVFVSGSAVAGAPGFDLARLQDFARKLGKRIIEHEYNLVSGLGLGIGADVLVGAVDGAYNSPSSMRDRLILRPFPWGIAEERKAMVSAEWRRAMISMAGFSLFLSGNRLYPDSGDLPKPAKGVLEEFEIGTTGDIHSYPIPVGATGYAAEKIWTEVSRDPGRYYGPIDIAKELAVLGEPTRTDEELLAAIISIIDGVRNYRPGR
jgi:hypothetical protein